MGGKSGSNAPRADRRDRSLRYTLIYSAFGATWILVSDLWLLSEQGHGDMTATIWSITKGLVYVAITSSLLYWMMRRNGRHLREQADELEQRVTERTSELMALNEELSSFAYAVSHDLRSPLRAINGFAQMLGTDYGDKLDAQALAAIERIKASSVKMGQLIDGLLDLARATQAPMVWERVSLSEVAESAATDLREHDPARVVRLEIEPNIVVDGDPRMLRNVVDNLMQNAWKYSANRADALVHFGVREEDRQRVYYVSDNGVGFSQEDAGKLFRPFQRLHSPQEFPGEGIGLATVYRIIQRHGGRGWAQGQLGEGATFAFVLGEPGSAG